MLDLLRQRAGSNRSWCFTFRSSKAFVAFVVAYAVFTDQFVFAAIVPVAPFSLHTRIGIPTKDVQTWVALLLGIYGAACFVSSPPWGYYSDRSSSRRTPFLLGLIILLAATMLLWFSRNRATAVLARILQGFANTVIWTTGLAIMVDTAGEAHVGEYMGWVGLALNAGSLVAPLLGGLVFARRGYNAVFAMALGVIAVDILARLLMIQRHDGKDGQADIEDWHSFASHPVGVAGFPETQFHMVPPTSEEPRRYSHSAAANLRRNSAWEAPTMVRLLVCPRFIAALEGIFVQAVVMSAFQAVLPLAVHTFYGWNSTLAGLMFLPLTAPALLGPLIGKVVDRTGPRLLAVTGFAMLCPSLILLRYASVDDAGRKGLLCFLLVLIGSGVTLTLEPLMAEITYVTSEQERGRQVERGQGASIAQAYALFNMAWAAGNTVGPFWGGLIMDKAGWDAVAWSLGLLAGVSAVPTLLWCGGWIFDSARDRKVGSKYGSNGEY